MHKLAVHTKLPIHPKPSIAINSISIHSEHVWPSCQHKTAIRLCALLLFFSIDHNILASHIQHYPPYHLALSNPHRSNNSSTAQRRTIPQQQTSIHITT